MDNKIWRCFLLLRLHLRLRLRLLLPLPLLRTRKWVWLWGMLWNSQIISNQKILCWDKMNNKKRKATLTKKIEFSSLRKQTLRASLNPLPEPPFYPPTNLASPLSLTPLSPWLPFPSLPLLSMPPFFFPSFFYLGKNVMNKQVQNKNKTKQKLIAFWISSIQNKLLPHWARFAFRGLFVSFPFASQKADWCNKDSVSFLPLPHSLPSNAFTSCRNPWAVNVGRVPEQCVLCVFTHACAHPRATCHCVCVFPVVSVA